MCITVCPESNYLNIVVQLKEDVIMLDFRKIRIIIFSVFVSLVLYLPAYSQNTAYIADEDGGQVCVVDLDTNMEIKVIQVSTGSTGGPYWMAKSSDQSLVAASLHDAQGVALIDPVTMTNIADVSCTILEPDFDEPEAIAINSTGTRVYVADEHSSHDGESTLFVVDVATQTCVIGPIELDNGTTCEGAENMVISPDDSTLYITCEDSSTVVSVATTGFAVTDIADDGTHGIAIDPAGTFLYYGDGNTVIQYSIAGGAPTTIEYDGCRMYGGAISPSGDRLYCVDDSNELDIFSTSSGNLIMTVALTGGSGAPAVAVSCDGAFAYVPNGDQLNIVNTATFNLETVILTCTNGRGIVVLDDCTPIVKAPIPTLSEWGLITMAGILGIVGFMVIRRRKVTA